MSYYYPTVNDFKLYFTRDFPYGTDPNTSVLDSDIEKAQGEAKFIFNGASFAGDQDEFSMLFNYLTAHYLVTDLQNSSQGISGKYTFLESSKSVGSVSASYSIPDRILANPQYAYLMKTNYGAKYLMLIYPLMIGQIFTVCGDTRP